jgi:hypothetical protein
LPDQALRRHLGLEGVLVDAETANVRMRRNEVEAAELLALGDGGDGLGIVSQAMSLEVTSCTYHGHDDVRCG